jgi:uncharacterized protein with FMN-binding domain
MTEKSKKLGLSAVVVASFLFAYWRQHHVDDDALPVILPSTNTTTTTPTQGLETPASTPTSPQAPTATPIPITPSATPTSQGKYRNGTYTGAVADAFYGNVQVEATITGGKITKVTFLDYPQDRSTSIRINSIATPELSRQAIQAQSANVDGVSGASATSQAFRESLADALGQATP